MNSETLAAEAKGQEEDGVLSHLRKPGVRGSKLSMFRQVRTQANSV